MAKVMQQCQRLGFLAGIVNPYFRQALIGRQFTSCTSQVLALNAGTNALSPQPVHRQRRHDQIGGLCKAQHVAIVKPLRFVIDAVRGDDKFHTPRGSSAEVRMVTRPTGSGGEPSSPNCGASAGVRLVNLISPESRPARYFWMPWPLDGD